MEISSDSFLNQPAPNSLRKKSAKPAALADSSKTQRPPSATVKSSKASKQKAGSYRDWQVREEATKRKGDKSSTKSTAMQSASNTQKMGASMTASTAQKQRRDKKSVNKARGSKSRSKSRLRSASHETTDDIRKRVQMQFNNYMEQKFAMDEEISLLEDSQATPPRDIKKQIVKQQQVNRKRSEEAKMKSQKDEQKKKDDSMHALALRFKSQTAVFRKEQEAARQEKDRRSKERPPRSGKGLDSNQAISQYASAAQDGPQSKYKVGKQVTELRQWIEKSMKDEHMQSWDTPSLNTEPSAQNLEIPGVALGSQKPPKRQATRSKSKSVDKAPAADVQKKQNSNKMNTSVISNKSLDKFASTSTGKAKMLKHQVPGNSVLTEIEQGKLGARENRYGVFGRDGNSHFDEVVSEQRSKLLEMDGEGKKQQVDWHPSKAEASQVKQVLGQALKSLGSRTSIRMEDESSQQQSASSGSEESEFEDEDMGLDTPVSEDSSDKIPVKQSPPQKQHRTMVNQPVKNDLMDEQIVPGILNTQTHCERLNRQKQKRESDAAQVIQRHFRGHKGRKLYKRAQKKENERVEYEYEKLNRELKSDTQYNLKSYLAQKKNLREKIGMVDSISADEIAEVIGESGSINSHRIKQSGTIQLQNFFKADSSKTAASGKDPLSLISIFAKRNGVVPDQQKERRLRPDKTSSRDRSGRHKQSRRQKAFSTDSAIEEEYSADFSDSVPKEESIIEEDFIKTSSGSISKSGLRSGRKGSSGKAHVSGSYRNKPQRDEQDSIAEEVIDEESFQDEKADSIKEDSIANEVESFRSDDKRNQTDSIAEDSIIKEEYDNDNFASYNASQSLQARNKLRFGMHSSAGKEPESKPLNEFQKKQSADQLKLAEEQAHNDLKRNHMIGSLMSEMKEYEKATMSEALVDRLEKIMVSSMAKKDQIIMAQRLSELDQEKRHAEEINKIREEQIKLMSQLMLLGPVGGAGGAPPANAELSAKYREDLLHSIQKIIEKPIQIKNETVHVNYSVSKAGDDQFLASDKLGVSTSVPRKTYLEEYDESRKFDKHGPIVSQSRGTYQDMVEEDIQLRLGHGALEASQSRPKIADSIDDLVGDVTSAIEESIKDEVDNSRFSNSKVSKGSNQESKSKDKKEAQKSLALFQEVEKAIDSERSDREEKLARDLKKRKISPRTYDRGIKDVERWVVREKKELMSKQRRMAENSKEMQKYLDRFRKDKSSVPTLNRIVSPRPDSTLMSYQDDSQTSDQVHAAMRQSYLIEKDLTGMSPEQKHAMKKRDAALNLIEQKEKAIAKALNEKMNKYTGGQAEELLQQALELDIEAEVERRFEAAKQNIEESRGLESARSANSYEKSNRTKKSVQFAKSVASTKPTTVSTERFRVSHSKLDEDSMQESIQMAESISQSLRSQSVLEVSKSRSAQKLNTMQHSHEKFSPQQAKNKASPRNQNSDEESMIESDYSQEFVEQSMTSQEVSKSGTASKAKLNAKVKDIEDSAAYSENFEEESMAKSATLDKDASASKELRFKMDTVKEESVDDSAQDQSQNNQTQSMLSSGKQSKGEHKAESSMGSLPSEDLSVKDSVRSVDWKFDVKQGSLDKEDEAQLSQSSEKRQNSYIKEEKVEESQEITEEEDSSSDLNTRDEIADLESCPDAIGQSGSMSANDQDMLNKADAITEELLELILKNYEEEEEYNTNACNEQPDEEEFKDKFPWTMDKKPEPKPAPKPVGVKMGAQPRPPKTLKEIKDEEYMKSHNESVKKINDRDQQIIDFLDFMCKRVDLKELINALNKPISRDPMKILSQIVNCYDEDDSIDKINDDTLTQAQQQILQQGFFNKTDREYVMMGRMRLNKAAVEDSDQLTVSQEEMENINNVHHYSLFESLNEALDQFRPYENKGEPMPWSKNTRVIKTIETESQAKKILQKARDQVISWMRMRAGTNTGPLPDAPQPTQDEMGEEILPPPLEEGEEERRNMNRQEKLAELMTDDIIENDGLWVDYEVQDTQTRFDLADMILHHLAGEIAEFLHEKK